MDTGIRVTALTVCVLIAAGLGAQKGWQSVTVDPPAPPPVCRLIRPEVFDLVVPGRGPVQDEGAKKEPGVRSTACRTESTSAVNGVTASLWVALVRFGRHDGDGPRCITRDGALLIPLNSRSYRVALGDGAVYVLGGDPGINRVISFTVCLGSYLTYVVYETVGLTDASIVGSATTVAQEVLSRL